MRRFVIALAFASSLGFVTPLRGARSNSEPVRGAGSLEAALGTISADEIRSDIFFIASDELGGRDTPSTGQRVAARFIRARLQRLGIQPGAPTGYFYEYPLAWPKLDEAATFARWNAAGDERALALGSDYFFSSRSLRDVSLEGAVVFCGAGKKSELDKCELAGKWALVTESDGRLGDLEKSLVEKGALGALMTPAEDYKGKPYGERFARELGSLQSGRVSWPRKETPGAAPTSFAFLWLAPSAAVQLDARLGADEKPPKLGSELAGRFAHTRKLQGDGGKVICENVCGFWPGSDPVLKNEVIIVSAHYDHVGTDSKGVIFNGADDNGSGTCGLLALAEALTQFGPLRRSVMLMWVSGEEKGLWGSQAWTENPWLPDGAMPVCDINVDMIGRNAPEYLMVTPTAKLPEHNGLVTLGEKFAPLEGFGPLDNADRYWGRSDQINYSKNLKIPVVFFFNGEHDDYHQSTDDPDKIDYDKIRRVMRLVLRMIDALQTDKLEL